MDTWVRYGQLACIFAQVMVKQADEHGWRTIVVSGLEEEGSVVGELGPLLREPPKELEALQVVFPEESLNSVEGVVNLVNDLCQSESWYWEEVDIPNEYRDEHLLVGLRWKIPSTDCVSWVLGFADIETMPFTRRAPFLALAFRTKPAPEDDNDPSRAHLAHMTTPFEEQEKHDAVWAKTEERRGELLKGELEHAAKARVAFCLPRETTARLCQPKGDISDE